MKPCAHEELISSLHAVHFALQPVWLHLHVPPGCLQILTDVGQSRELFRLGQLS